MNAKEFNKCLKLIRAGDKSGIEKIYNCYYEKLLLTVNLEVNNIHNSEDIVSNVIASIFINAKNYKYIKCPDAWMYQAAIFAIINFKKMNEKYVYTELIDDVYSVKEDKINLKITVEQAIEKLPKRQREIVLLHFIYGLKIRETAKLIGVSASTVNREIFILKEELNFLLDL